MTWFEWILVGTFILEILSCAERAGRSKTLQPWIAVLDAAIYAVLIVGVILRWGQGL